MANSLHCFVVTAAIFLSVQSSPSCTPKEVFGWCRGGFNKDCIQWVCDDEIGTTSMPKRSDKSRAKNIVKNPRPPLFQLQTKKWKNTPKYIVKGNYPLPPSIVGKSESSGSKWPSPSATMGSFPSTATSWPKMTNAASHKAKMESKNKGKSYQTTQKFETIAFFQVTSPTPEPKKEHKSVPKKIKKLARQRYQQKRQKRRKYFSRLQNKRRQRQHRTPPPLREQIRTLRHRHPPRPIRPHYLLLQESPVQRNITSSQPSSSSSATNTSLATTTATSTTTTAAAATTAAAVATTTTTSTTSILTESATMVVGTTTPATTATTTINSHGLSAPTYAPEKRESSLIATKKCQRKSVIRRKNWIEKTRERMRLLRTRHHETRPIPTTVSQSDNVRETVSREKKVENVNVTATAAVKNSLGMNMSFLANLSNVTLTVDCGDFLMVETYSQREVCFHYDRNKESMLKSNLF